MKSMETPITWPPAYSIKRHPRAKRIKLQTSIKNGLVITLPLRFSEKKIPLVLEENKEWIIKQLSSLGPKLAVTLPEIIMLPAVNQTWPIHYLACKARMQIIERPTGEIVIAGDVTKIENCQLLLLKWIKLKATQVLLPRLKALSECMQLEFKKVTLRDQRTVWGSCTASKAISLNYKLIFLPSHLIDYVLIHELSHLRHLNHSTSFWLLVQTYDKNWKQHRRELRSASQFIPHWAM